MAKQSQNNAKMRHQQRERRQAMQANSLLSPMRTFNYLIIIKISIISLASLLAIQQVAGAAELAANSLNVTSTNTTSSLPAPQATSPTSPAVSQSKPQIEQQNQERLQLGGVCASRATCRQKSRRLELESGADKSPCYCDEKCVLFDDCCKDSRFTEPLSKRLELGRDNLKKVRSRWHCHRINAVFGDVLIRAQCAPGWLDFEELKLNPEKRAAAESIKANCEHFSKFNANNNNNNNGDHTPVADPIGMMLPITDVSDGITYANMYCLRCNKLSFRARGNRNKTGGAPPPTTTTTSAPLTTSQVANNSANIFGSTQIRDKYRKETWIYWKPMLECNYDLDKDDRDSLIDLISSSKGRALEYSSERNKWVIRPDYNLLATTTTPASSATITTTTPQPTTTITTTTIATNTTTNTTDNIVRECNITPTIPESIEHMIRFCRKNTIDSCPETSASPPVGGADSSNVNATTTTTTTTTTQQSASSTEELERARLECHYGHQSLVYGQHSRLVYHNLACAICNQDKNVFCHPRTRKLDSLTGAGNATGSWSPGDLMPPEVTPRNNNFKVRVGSSMGSFSLVFDLNGEGRVGATQTCNTNQVFDPFYLTCRCLICGLNLRYVDGKCVSTKTHPYENLNTQSATTTTASSSSGDGGTESPSTMTPPTSQTNRHHQQQQRQTHGELPTITLTTNMELNGPVKQIVESITSVASELIANVASGMSSSGRPATSGRATDNNHQRHHHPEGSHLDGGGGQTAEVAAAAAAKAREIDSSKLPTSLEESGQPLVGSTVAETMTTMRNGDGYATNEPKLIRHANLTLLVSSEEQTESGDENSNDNIQAERRRRSKLDAVFDSILTQMNIAELPEATADSRRKFADCAKIAIPAPNYRLFTLALVAPNSSDSSGAASNKSEVKLVDLERQHQYWRRQEHQLSRHQNRRNRNFNRNNWPAGNNSLEVVGGGKFWAYIEKYNLTLASSQFELIRRKSSGPIGYEFELLVCSPFSTNAPPFNPKFPWLMALITNICLTISIASLSMYLLLYCLSLMELRPMVVEMLQAGTSVAHFSSRNARSNSLSTANRSQSLPSRGVACLALSLLIAYLLFIAGHQFQAPQNSCTHSTGCAIIAIATYYCFLISFNWMFILSYDIWRTLRLATCQLKAPALHSQSKRFASYMILALGTAALISGSAILLDQMELADCAQTASKPADEIVDDISCGVTNVKLATNQLEECSLLTLVTNRLIQTYKPKFGHSIGSCWFANRRALALFFGFPVTAIMLINLLFFLHSSYMVIRTSVATSNSAKDSPTDLERAQSHQSATLTSDQSLVGSEAKSDPPSAGATSWIPIGKCASCGAKSQLKPTIKCEILRADSTSSSNYSCATDYTQQNSLTANSMMSVQTMQSHLDATSSTGSPSCSSSTTSSLKSDSGCCHSEHQHQANVDSAASTPPPPPSPTGGAGSDQQQPKRKLESRSKSSSSIVSSTSKHSNSIAANLAMKYDAGYNNLSAFAATIVKDYRLYCRLSTMMGLTWLTGLMASLVDGNECLWYLFVVLNTLQGLFIFIAFGCKSSKLVNAKILVNYLQFKWQSARMRMKRESSEEATKVDEDGKPPPAAASEK